MILRMSVTHSDAASAEDTFIKVAYIKRVAVVKFVIAAGVALFTEGRFFNAEVVGY